MIGSYGSGKSSILESYEKKREKSFLHISLASFEKSCKKDISREEEQSLIEGKILNQLIHQIPEKEIPKITFRTSKESIPNCILTFQSVSLFSILSSLIYLFNLEDFNDYLEKYFWEALSPYLISFLSILTPFILLVSLFYFSFRLIKIKNEKNIFTKFNIHGNEVEIFQKETEKPLYFDKYLDELLYILSHCEKDIIVFEDLDRYENTSPLIFERLREINFLINSYLSNNNKNNIYFFYLIREDLFLEKDKTKFFDFIIPVIPVVDSHSSFEIMWGMREKITAIENFEKEELKSFKVFLRKISLYIDDYRLIKNIFNEFQLYHEIIYTDFKEALDIENLFSLILYKNIFSEDFSKLSFRRGFIYALFEEETKTNILKESLESKNLEQTKEQKISLYEESFTLINKKFESGYYNPSYNISQNQFNQFKNKIERVEKEKEELDSIHERISNPLVEILKENKIQDFSTIQNFFKNPKANFDSVIKSHYFDLIKFLVYEGYINEKYPNYISYFYPNSLSLNDREFILSIQNRKEKKPDYKLDSIKNILEHLKSEDFSKEEVLNYDLLNFFLDNLYEDFSSHHQFLTFSSEEILEEKDYKSQLLGLINTVSKKISFYFNFLYQYCSEKNKKIFVNLLNSQNHDFFKISNSTDTKTFIDYLILTLISSDSELLDKLNENNEFSSVILNFEELIFLSIEDHNFYHLNENEKKDIIYSLNNLSIEFRELGSHLGPFYQDIYKNNLYKFTLENIDYVLEKEFPTKNKEEIRIKRYSLIRKDPKSPLLRRVKFHLEEFLSLISEDSSKIEDEEEAIKEILNNKDLSKELKIQYIELLSSQIEKISDIKDKELWSFLLQKNIPLCSHENVLMYFKDSLNSSSLDSTLIDFINQGEEDFTSFEEFKEDISKLGQEILKSREIQDDRYKSYLKTWNRVFNSFPFKGIPSSKFKILVDLSIIKMTKKNLSFMRDNYKEDVFYFINKNLKDYLNLKDVRREEVIQILKLENVISEEDALEDEGRKDLISLLDEPISLQELNISTKVQEFILEKYFDKEDIPYLILSFDSLTLRKEILLSSLSQYKEEIENKYKEDIPLSLSELLMKDKRFSQEFRLSLFLKKDSSSKEEIREFIKNWNEDFFNKIYSNKRVNLILKNELNQTFLEFLKKNQVISDYSEKEENDKIYFKIKRKKHLK